MAEMSAFLQTSSTFASAVASGADWRDVGRKILESLESIRTDKDGMTVGFLYVTPELSDDLAALLALLKNVTRISQWFGAIGVGICGNGVSFAGVPAGVAMIGAFPEETFSGFSLPGDATQSALQTISHASLIALIHGRLCPQSVTHLNTMRDAGLYTVGGFTSGAHIAEGQIGTGDVLSGLVLGPDTHLMTATSFGCVHAGPALRITQCSGNSIETIDDRPAFAVLNDALLALESRGVARQGHVHAAFPVPGADMSTLLVRNVVQADEASGIISVAHSFERGDMIQFVYRDDTTAATDLTQVLKTLYARAANEAGATNVKPKALLYFGCGARMAPGVDEAAIIAGVLGDIPMAGFYTSAEICNGHVYGYTGIMALFL
jgi:small ligand-binding sensory domain FIST